MSIFDYIKDKMIFIIWNLILYIFLGAAMYLFEMSIFYIIVTFIIWFMPLFLYILIEGIKYKRYYDEAYKILDALDKKYLFPEVMKDPQFIEGKVIDDILKAVSRDMHENVKYYKDKQLDYREYIESWVHEVKTPIASSKLIIENNENTVTRKIDNEITKIESYVEQSLYYARSNDVSSDYVIKKISLEEIIRQVIKKNYREFLSRNIRVKLEDINRYVYCDGKWIEFIISQIVGNSLKYVNKEKSYIKFYSEEDKNSVTIVIEDNGIGIDEADINRVFDKGFTGHNGRVFIKSTGIGLYLCKKLCVKLNIGISIESKVNEWTKVKLSFPIDNLLIENYSSKKTITEVPN